MIEIWAIKGKIVVLMEQFADGRVSEGPTGKFKWEPIGREATANGEGMVCQAGDGPPWYVDGQKIDNFAGSIDRFDVDLRQAEGKPFSVPVGTRIERDGLIFLGKS